MSPESTSAAKYTDDNNNKEEEEEVPDGVPAVCCAVVKHADWDTVSALRFIRHPDAIGLSVS